MASRGMEPTITQGSGVYANSSAYSSALPARWDIVTFTPPSRATTSKEEQVWVMRIVGLPGETISYAGSTVEIQGKTYNHPPNLKHIQYLGAEKMSARPKIKAPRVVLGPQEYFVLGDNPKMAADSRYCGALPLGNITGRVEQ